MTDVSPFSLATSNDRTIQGFVHTASRSGPRPTVVICHGFKGFMEWGVFPFLADLLAKRGLTAVRFNFTGSGMKPGDDLVTDLDAFRTATFSKDHEEVVLVLEALGNRVAQGLVDRARIGLFGHSRGGGSAILAAADPRTQQLVKSLVTWSAVSTFDRLPEAEKAVWRQEGIMTIANARTGQELPIGSVVLEDLETHSDRIDILAAASRIQAPWLIVHGGDDETVPIAEAHQLAEAASAPVALEEIPEGLHTFGATHPFSGSTPQLIQALNTTQAWFRKYL